MSSLVKSIQAGRVTMAAAAMFASVAMTPAAFGAFTPFIDEFDTLDSALNSNLDPDATTTWTTYRNNADVPEATAVGGNLVLNIGSTTSNRRTAIVSTRADFNFFTQPLTFQLNIADLAGAPYSSSPSPGGSGLDNIANAHYMMVGQVSTNSNGVESAGRFFPTVNDLNNFADGIWVKVYQSARSTAADAPVKWWIDVASVADGGHTVSGAPASQTLLARELTGEPTQLTLTLDGTGSGIDWSLTVGGANFIPAHGGSDTLSGNFTNLTEAHFTSTSYDVDPLPTSISNQGKFHLALGSYNQSTVHEQTIGYFDSISVVPEPTSFAALAVGSLLLARRRRS